MSPVHSFQSRVPLRFRGDCVLTATYIIHSTPAPLLSNKSPFNILNNTTVDYDFMRVFGCLCYAFTQVNYRYKFEPRARKDKRLSPL